MALRSLAYHPPRDAVTELVRSISACHNLWIEGPATHPASPANINRAFQQDFSGQPDVAQLQRIALLHLEAESELHRQVEDEKNALHSAFRVAVHTALYSRLSNVDGTTEDGRAVEPGS